MTEDDVLVRPLNLECVVVVRPDLVHRHRVESRGRQIEHGPYVVACRSVSVLLLGPEFGLRPPDALLVRKFLRRGKT